MPALLIRMSRVSTSSTARSICARFVTSRVRGVTRGSEFCCAPLRFPAYILFAPRRRASSTSARPMPRLAPVIKTVLFAMFITILLSKVVSSVYFLLAITNRPARRIRPATKILALGRFGLPKAHVGADVPAVQSCPAAHTPQWSDERPSELSQRILDRDGLRFRHALCNQSCGFKIAKSSGEHALRNASEVTAQLPVTIGPLLQREQNPGRPPADEDRRRKFRSLYRVHSLLPPAKPSHRNRNLRFTSSLAGRRGYSLPALARQAQLGTSVIPTPKLVPSRLQTRDRTPDSIFQDVGLAYTYVVGRRPSLRLRPGCPLHLVQSRGSRPRIVQSSLEAHCVSLLI